jgi:YHS domain-containing protein
MIRLLIWLVIVYLLYRTLRRWVRIGPARGGSDAHLSEDLMVKDPCCGVFFLVKDGYHLRHGGEDLYFCSPECRDKYQREHPDTGP